MSAFDFRDACEAGDMDKVKTLITQVLGINILNQINTYLINYIKMSSMKIVTLVFPPSS